MKIRSGRTWSVAKLSVVVGLSLSLAACGLRGDEAGADVDGVKSGPGFDGKTITVGAIAVTSGPLAVSGEPLLEGLTTYVNALNDRGGIGGKYPVEIKVSDNGFNASKAVQQVRDTLPEVSLYATLFGSAITHAIIPQLEKDNALAFMNAADGAVLRSPNIVSTITPYESQVSAGIEYVSSQDGGADKVYCGAYLEGDIAAAGERGADFAYEELGLTKGTNVELPFTTTDYTPQVQQLKSAECDVVSFVAPVGVTSILMSDSSKLGFEPQFIASNVSWTAGLKDAPIVPFMQKNNYLITYNGALYGDTEHSTAMEDLMAAREKYAPDAGVDTGFTSGYASGMLMEQILTRALESGDLSRDGIRAAEEDLDALEFGGIMATFPWGTPEERVAPSQVTIVKVDPSEESTMKVVEFGFESAVAAKYEYK